MPLLIPSYRELFDLSLSDEDAQAKIADYCRIDLADIEDTLAKHPGLYAYAVACYEMAEVKEAQAKWDFESAQSQAFEILVSREGDKKWTVAEIEKKVKNQPLVKEAYKSYIEARLATARMKALSKGLDSRGSMLVQIASRQKAEAYNRV